MKKTLTALLVAASLTSAVYAQDSSANVTKKPGEGEATAELKQASSSPWTFEAEVPWVSAYVSDGFNYGDEGLFLQPWATVSYQVSEPVSVFFNVWANFTDEKYDEMDYFDELDLTGGAEFTFGRWTVGAEYIYYFSPADNWDDIHEVGASLSFDDSDLFLPVALNPYVAVYQEVYDGGGDEGTSGEVGIEPGYEFEDLNVSVALPVTVGLGFNDFYIDDEGDDELVGYVSVGLTGTYNFTENWYITGGAQYWYLTADATENTNDGDDDIIVYTAGVGFSY